MLGLERVDDAGLAREASGDTGLRLVGLQENLDRDGLRQARTAGFEDDAHASLAEDTGDRVLAVDGVADFEGVHVGARA